MSVFFPSHTLSHADQTVKKYPNKCENKAHKKFQPWQPSSQNDQKQKNMYLRLFKPAHPCIRSFFQAKHINWKVTVLEDLLTKQLGQPETTRPQHHGKREWQITTTNSTDFPGMHLKENSNSQQKFIVFQTLCSSSPNNRGNGSPLGWHELGQVQQFLLFFSGPFCLFDARVQPFVPVKKLRN